MRRRQLLLIAAASTAVASVSAAGYAALGSASDMNVGFECTGPAGFKITGKTTELGVTEENGNVVVTVGLGKLSTGIDLRDHHMRDKYLEVGKFPTTTLTIARSALKVPATGRAEGDAAGTLQLHGVSRPVTVHYDASAEGAGFLAHGKFRINMNEYGIVVPSYLGITVKPDVDVNASFRVAGN